MTPLTDRFFLAPLIQLQNRKKILLISLGVRECLSAIVLSNERKKVDYRHLNEFNYYTADSPKWPMNARRRKKALDGETALKVNRRAMKMEAKENELE